MSANKDIQFLSSLLLSFLIGIIVWQIAVPKPYQDLIRYKTLDPHLEYFRTELSKEKSNYDMLIIGSSSMMNGLQPQVLEDIFESQAQTTSPAWKIINLGVNWFGHDLNYDMLYTWINKHNTKALILEVPYLYRYDPHPNYHKIASVHSILLSFVNSPIQALKSYFYFFPSRITQLYLPLITSPSSPEEPPLYNRHKQQGYVKVPEKSHRTPNGPIALKDIPPRSFLKTQSQEIRYAHHRFFLNKMVELCQQHDIKLFLCATPKQHINQLPPWLETRYSKLGTILVPPPQLLQHQHLWRDSGHLNHNGSTLFSQWLAHEIVDLHFE